MVQMFHEWLLYCAEIVFYSAVEIILSFLFFFTELIFYANATLCAHVCPLSAGVSSLISLLTSAREADQPRLNVLLCEGVMAVYLALLIHGLGTHSSNELFRLAAHPLNNRMWAAVFGGGARLIIKPKRTEAPPGRIITLSLFC